MPSILNDERYQDLWRELEPQLQSIMDRTPIRCAQYMDLYTKIFKFYSTSNLIAPKPSNSQNVPFYHQRIFTADICRKLASLFTVNLERVYIKLKDLIGGDGMNLLRAYADEWEQFEPSLRMIDGIFSYVNRYWSTRLTSRYLGETLKDALEVTSVYGEGILYWQSVVVERLAPRLTEYCLAIISEKRTVNSDCPEKEELLLKVTDTYVCLGYNVREKYIKDQSTNRKKHIGFFSEKRPRRVWGGSI
ncbi:hypothetical protein ACOME3_002626 [Neoechinorhynchus agilis]